MEITKNQMSEDMYNYIIFSYIKEFVNELGEHFEEESLISYINFINSADPLTEAKEYIKSFEKALDGKHRAKLCSGVYVNIPKFLEDKKVEKPIRGCLEALKTNYSGDMSNCKEYEFFLKSLNGFSTTIMDQDENLAEKLKSASTKDGDKAQFNELIKKTMESILGDRSYKFGEESSEEEEDSDSDSESATVKKKPIERLNSERMAKIIALIMYEKVDLIDFTDNDKNEVKKLARLILKNSIRELLTKHKEVLFTTVFSLDFLKKVDVMSLFNSMKK